MQVFLRFIAGPSKGQTYELPPAEYVIGRGETCHIQAVEAGVSRQHTRLWSDADGWHVEDLGSQNGTFVNGGRIQRQQLVNEDVIWVSSHRIQVELRAVEQDWPESVTVTQFDGEALYLAETAESTAQTLPDSLAERKLEGLQAILEATANTTDPNQLLEEIVAKLLDVFPAADSVGVLVKDPASGELTVKCRKDRSRRFGGNLTVPATIIEHVVQDKRGILLGNVGNATPVHADTGEDDPAGSRMGAPLSARNESYGVLYVNCSENSFSRDDVNLLTTIAGQAGLALHSARMHIDMGRQQRLDHDVRLARQIQRSLLPDTPPALVGLDLAAHYEAAFQIGGDFYDFIWHDKDRLAVVIGDVSGKAISAALYMARLTGELRSRTGIAQTPRRLLRQVNDALVSIGDDGMFATLIYAVYDFQTRGLVFSNAGHMSPLLRREGHVSIVQADSAHVPPLGIMTGMDIGEASLQLENGDLLVFTTDGIHEARNAEGEEYGEKRLARCIRHAEGSANDVIHAILDDVANHAGAVPARDDVTIVVMSVGKHRARRRTSTDPGDQEPSAARPVTAT